ncbi:MAG: penicillin-binding protein 2 [Anaerolineales bacterium]
MNKALWFLIVVAVLVVNACSGAPVPPTVIPTETPVPVLSEPGVHTTSVPDVTAAARTYLEAWQAEDYAAMYAMLTQLSRDAISAEDFEARYRGVAVEAALSGVDTEILQSLVHPRSAQVAYRVILHSVLVGDISAETVMNLSLEDGAWHVQWDDTLILPQLANGNTLVMQRYVPGRANIYDRNGHALVAQNDAVSVGLDAAAVGEKSQEDLLNLLWQIFGRRADLHPSMLGPRVDLYRSYGWYLPIGELSSEVAARYQKTLSRYDGVILQSYRARYYFDSGAAPHVVGYVSAIQSAEKDFLLRQGYALDERVGRAGIEQWAEPYLSGQRGGALYVFDASGKVVTKLAEREATVPQAVTTTLDQDLQLAAQKALIGYNGAIVVMERDTGRILAMASSPGFDPNAFEYLNPNSGGLLEFLGNENAPLLNRATQGQYPLGSVFKIVTMAAALQSGLYTADTTYNCGYFFDEIPGLHLNDWTYEHFLRDDKTPPSGLLTLPQGLMRSCNPFFWHIGLDLFTQGQSTAIADMARAFGLGAPTGIYGLPANEEAAGQILNPREAIDAVNNAIGQGGTLVTPLQVARFIAAIGNGGTLYRPQLIEQIAAPGETPSYVFAPKIDGQLPLSPENLQLIQQAMTSVVEDRRGTAYFVLGSYSKNYRISIAGKTGTAQDPPRDSHAWFAGYTFAENPDKPDIAIAVLVENGGEGSEVAAPIFRGMVQTYFQGSRTAFPWEAGVGVLRSPTPTPEGGSAP